MNVIYGGVAVLCIMLCIEGIQKQREEKNDCKFLEQLLFVIQKIQSFYSMNRLVDEAVYNTLSEVEGEMFQQVQNIYYVLETQQEEVRRNYMEQQSNRFLKMLTTILCIENQYSSGKQRTILQKNLQFLKQEVTLELWKKQQIRTLFAGLSFLIWIPAFFLKPIEQWGIFNIPELVHYYHGAYGAYCVALFVLIIWGTDWILGQLKNMEAEYKISYRKLEWIENQEWIKVLFDWLEQKYYSHYLKRRKRLKEIGEKISPRQFLLKQCLMVIRSSFFILFLKLHFFWIPIVGIISWEIPWWEVYYQEQIKKRGIQNEILYYETIFLMLMEAEGVKEVDVLEWLEEGSNFFKDTIVKCLLDLYGGDQKALENLKEIEPCKDFQRLVDNLIVSDQTGFKVAFEGLEQERQNCQEKKKQDQEIQIKKRAAIGQIVAFLPISTIIGIYLIVPFVLESMVQLSAFMGQMNGQI